MVKFSAGNVQQSIHGVKTILNYVRYAKRDVQSVVRVVNHLKEWACRNTRHYLHHERDELD